MLSFVFFGPLWLIKCFSFQQPVRFLLFLATLTPVELPMCSESIKFSLLVLLLGVAIASVTDLKLNLLGSVLSGLAIATTCVGQIVSYI